MAKCLFKDISDYGIFSVDIENPDPDWSKVTCKKSRPLAYLHFRTLRGSSFCVQINFDGEKCLGIEFGSLEKILTVLQTLTPFEYILDVSFLLMNNVIFVHFLSFGC